MGPLGGSFWASWGPLGGLLGPLGAPKAGLPRQDGFQGRFWKDFGSNLAPKSDPKSTKNDTKNPSKIKPKFKSEKMAFRDPLGGLLGRSWAVWGAILRAWEAKIELLDRDSCKKLRNDTFRQDELPRRVWDPTWPLLDGQSGQNDPPEAPQRSPKATKNRSKKSSKK